MIVVKHKKNFLEMSGHAFADCIGKDIVCASISAIACGSFLKWKNNKKFLLIEDPTVPLISFFLKDSKDIKSLVEFEFLVFLIKEIYKNYPDNIEWKDI